MSHGDNPFEENKDGGNPFEEEDEALYPRYKDPFTKRTKSVKAMRKAEKKNMKAKQKLEKKKKKRDGKPKKKEEDEVKAPKIPTVAESPPNNNKNETIETGPTETTNHQVSPIRPANGSSTLPAQKSPNSPPKIPVPGYQTLDSRSPTQDIKKSPVLPNKRVLQLKTAGGNSSPVSPPLADKGTKKQIFIPATSASPENDSEPTERPNTLDVTSNANQFTTPHDKKHVTSPLVTKGRLDDDITRVRRSSSVSKMNKAKKKRKMRLRRKLKKKKKSDLGENVNVLEDEGAMSQVVMRRNQEARLATLQKEVAETEEIVRDSVVKLVHQRDSLLEDMLQKSEMLEETAYDFAQVANEARLKHRAKATCCGLGAKFRVCWYVCACNTGVKRKKKSKRQSGMAESVKLLSPRDAADLKGDTEDDSYKPTHSPKKAGTPTKPNQAVPDTTHSKSNGTNQGTGRTVPKSNKLTAIPDAVRSSLPNLFKRDSPKKDDSEGSFPRRKSSSVSSAQEVVKKPTKRQQEREKKEKEKKEQSYRLFADAEFEDDERRSRAISLLRMDDKRD